MEQDSVRTYRLRGSRITSPQQNALDKYWGIYGMEYSEDFIDIPHLFPNTKNVILEIGFGMGEATALIGRDFPETGFLAVEVHKPGIGKLMYDAVISRNYPVVMGTVLASTVFIVTATTISDLLNVMLDPRTKDEN